MFPSHLGSRRCFDRISFALGKCEGVPNGYLSYLGSAKAFQSNSFRIWEVRRQIGIFRKHEAVFVQPFSIHWIDTIGWSSYPFVDDQLPSHLASAKAIRCNSFRTCQVRNQWCQLASHLGSAKELLKYLATCLRTWAIGQVGSATSHLRSAKGKRMESMSNVCVCVCIALSVHYPDAYR